MIRLVLGTLLSPEYLQGQVLLDSYISDWSPDRHWSRIAAEL